MLAETWHLELAIEGLVLGGGVVVVARARRDLVPTGAAAVASVAAVVAGLATGLLVVAIGVAIWARAVQDPLATVARIAAVLLVAATVSDATSGSILAIAAAGVAGTLVWPRLATRRLAVACGLGLVALAGTTWLCAPDTEGAVVVGCTAAVPAVVGLLRASAGHDVPGRVVDWFPMFVLALWAVELGFVGRPEGQPATWVAIAALLGGLVAARRAGDAGRWWIVPAALGLVSAVVAARTIGLAADEPRWGWAAGISLSVLAAWGVAARRPGLR